MSNYFDLQNGPILNVNNSPLVVPKISQITYPGDDTAADPAGGQTITLIGSGFASGAIIRIDGSLVGIVSVVNSTTITFISPVKPAGSYTLYVVNTDGGTAISVPGIQYSGTPTWSTTAGSLGSYIETASIANIVSATSDSAVTYSLFSGSLPPGASLNASTGAITGASASTSSSTTYTFTIRATDAEKQDTDRTFSLTINPDVVTWSSPADNSTITGSVNQALANVNLSATASSGQSITYTANSLPNGLTISSNVITGTPTLASSSTSLLTAMAAVTGRTATRLLNFIIQSPIPLTFLVVAGGGSGGRADGYPGMGGGGGAGGLIETTANVSASSLTVTVGAGGAAGAPVGSNGANTTVTGTGINLVAIGGGRGGWYNSSGLAGADGGSGGGGGTSQGNGGSAAGAGLQPASASGGYGNNGANGGSYEPGSGGGAGGAGVSNGSAPGRSVTVPGYGAVTYAAALIYNNGGTNTGEGSGYYSGARTGGSGVAFLWYPDSYPAATATTGSPTYTVSGGYRVYRFTSSGTITF